jgi:hypothetical protein
LAHQDGNDGTCQQERNERIPKLNIGGCEFY